ncbi:MAG: diaminopropionate ammonia-lyase [Actinomycetota bacterium]|nr:diaminopropionate ammonia-lyase [Actinomycetota bacterium]
MRVVANPLRTNTIEDTTPSSVFAFHSGLAGYQATPLLRAPSVARALGVATALVKDESDRFGMPSFKILGASWAIYCALCELLSVSLEPVIPLTQLRQLLEGIQPLELVAATDGNHGRAVARMATLMGLNSHILVPDEMVPARRRAIVAEGARLTPIQGTYDDAVRAAAALADNHHLVISDTSWEGYQKVPTWVIDGYSTITHELATQLDALGERAPTVIAVQIGVGAFAAAMVRYAHQKAGTVLVGVEPADAACMLASIEAGHLVEVAGPHRSIMAGLNCGNASPVAWPLVSRGLDYIVAIDDDDARRAMRLLAQDGIVSGESGAAGLGGLLAGRRQLKLPPTSTVLIVSTEGATDPSAYERTVGRLPDVRAR